MSKSSSTQSFSILGLDIVGYSKNDESQLLTVQEDADAALAKSVEEIAPDANVEWIDAGDGGFLLVPGNVESALEIAKEHVSRMRWKNFPKMKEHEIFLRYAIHYGFVHIFNGAFGRKYASGAITTCARILGGMEQDLNGIIAVSEEYRDILTKMPRNSPATFIRQEPIQDKHGFDHSYHLIAGYEGEREDP